ncbi:hypothetical protein NDU88_004359 [Pleurodeles waltl]|uniref:Secreted protein n=1 Tax=Pleurodeles waltl TaxID=8319 RepID=A0AAV7SIP7_PLEWA|nr:hypothetical protein NDU88_004359 [Pleurodeles waltl]
MAVHVLLLVRNTGALKAPTRAAIATDTNLPGPAESNGALSTSRVQCKHQAAALQGRADVSSLKRGLLQECRICDAFLLRFFPTSHERCSLFGTGREKSHI